MTEVTDKLAAIGNAALLTHWTFTNETVATANDFQQDKESWVLAIHRAGKRAAELLDGLEPLESSQSINLLLLSSW